MNGRCFLSSYSTCNQKLISLFYEFEKIYFKKKEKNWFLRKAIPWKKKVDLLLSKRPMSRSPSSWECKPNCKSTLSKLGVKRDGAGSNRRLQHASTNPSTEAAELSTLTARLLFNVLTDRHWCNNRNQPKLDIYVTKIVFRHIKP